MFDLFCTFLCFRSFYFPLLLQRKDSKGKQLLCTFLCFCKEKLPKESSSKNPFCERGSLKSPQRGGAFAHKKARMLHTNANLHNDPPIKRTAFFRAGLFWIWLACRLISRTLACRCDILQRTDHGSLTEVILWERGSFVGVIHE